MRHILLVHKNFRRVLDNKLLIALSLIEFFSRVLFYHVCAHTQYHTPLNQQQQAAESQKETHHGTMAGFIFVQHLRGFLGQYRHLDICLLSTLRIMPQTITNNPPPSPFPSQILTLPKFWYHLAHSFSRKNVPFDFLRG